VTKEKEDQLSQWIAELRDDDPHKKIQEDLLDLHVKQDAKIIKFAERTRKILLGIFVLTLGLGVWNFVLQEQNSERAKEGRDNADEIQRQRIEATKSNCENQNQRNIRTVNRVRRLLLADITAIPANRINRMSQEEAERRLSTAIDRMPDNRARQIRSQLTGTIFIIDSLVPVRNCKRVVEETVPRDGPKEGS
jgi:hypothetical protein